MLATGDEQHEAAVEELPRLRSEDSLLVHNYVVVELTSLVHRRLGPAAVNDLHERLLPVFELAWIERAVHASAVSALLASARARPSFVDHVSFELMRRLAIERAFAFDPDFGRYGFETVP